MAAVDIPTAQEVQAAVDVTALYVPAAQLVHTLLLEGYFPGSQADRSPQAAVDVTALYVPTAQLVHTLLLEGYCPCPQADRSLQTVLDVVVHAVLWYFPTPHSVQVETVHMPAVGK